MNCAAIDTPHAPFITVPTREQYLSLSPAELVEILVQRDQQVAYLQVQVQKKDATLREQLDKAIRDGWQIEEFKRMLFGQKSERFVHYRDDVHYRQPSLGTIFDHDDIEAVITASRARGEVEQSLADQQQPAVTTNRYQKPHRGRQRVKRRRHDVEVIVEEVDYQGDKEGLAFFGTKVSEVYDLVPAKVVKKQTRFKQYIDKAGKIYKAPVPERIIEKGKVSNRLVAGMHVDKYVYSLPYYRQIRKLQRMGASLAPSTVNDWEEICYRKLKRLLKLLKKVINQQDYLQIDEVPINYVNDVGKGKCSSGYFWVVNAPRQKLVLFEFNPSRAGSVPRELLKDFKGKLQCDGLSSYKTAFKEKEEVTLLACLAHIRRGFFKAKGTHLTLARHFLNETRIIYDIEAYCDKKQITDNERVAIREAYIRPILDALSTWLERHRETVVPDSPIGRAFTYARNHWALMYAYLTDGKLLPDNNGAERAIRPVTLYRKNSLFAGNEHGAQRAALFFSLLGNL